MTMEYITSNKGGRKLAFENNISIKQKVLSNGTVWEDIMGGFCPGGFCPGDFVLGGILSRGILSEGFCPGGFVWGHFALEPISTGKPISLVRGYIKVKISKHDIW